jgi:hypothetical protein
VGTASLWDTESDDAGGQTVEALATGLLTSSSSAYQYYYFAGWSVDSWDQDVEILPSQTNITLTADTELYPVFGLAKASVYGDTGLDDNNPGTWLASFGSFDEAFKYVVETTFSSSYSSISITVHQDDEFTPNTYDIASRPYGKTVNKNMLIKAEPAHSAGQVTLRRKQGASGDLFTVNAGATLLLGNGYVDSEYDEYVPVTPNPLLIITGQDSGGTRLTSGNHITNNGQLDLYDGVSLRGMVKGVAQEGIAAARFKMWAGEICDMSSIGLTVWRGSQAEIRGGQIHSCHFTSTGTKNTGGVSVSGAGSTLTMSGGYIYDIDLASTNSKYSDTSYHVTGVLVSTDASFVMNGGFIAGTSAFTGTVSGDGNRNGSVMLNYNQKNLTLEQAKAMLSGTLLDSTFKATITNSVAQTTSSTYAWTTSAVGAP